MRSRIQNETKSWVAKTQREQLNTQNIFFSHNGCSAEDRVKDISRMGLKTLQNRAFFWFCIQD